DEVQASLASLPGLKFVWRMSGTADLVLVTRFKSMRDLTSFNATIQKIQHAKAETNIVVNTIKDIYAEVSRNAKQG
nr:Lrp/AsnC ligand binding domain-containing protein [Candidatus Sigynarchaeota archaeon]